MPDPAATDARAISHATCLACGCLCDDIAATVEGGQVVAAERACTLGLPWFLTPHPGEGHPAARVEGREVALDEALDRAAAILLGARSPVVWGLTHSSVEAVAEAVALADRLGATLDLAGSADRAARRAAFVRHGEVAATLGESKDRAGVVLFWGGHPDATHPRHAERYSIHPRGRFLTGPRTVIVVDVGATPSVGPADLRITLAPDRQAEALAVLRARAAGVALDPARVERATGRPLATWDAVLAALAAVPHAAIFFSPAANSLGPTGWDAALGLVRDLNRDGRRCVGLDLGEPGNVAGAGAVVTWQAGAPGTIDFGTGFPRHLPGEATLADRLARGGVDAVLAVGLDPAADLPPGIADRLAAIPRIEVSPGACRAAGPTVAIATGRLGLEVGGTVGRGDGVMLPLRPPLAGSRPTDRAILAALHDRLRSISTGSG